MLNHETDNKGRYNGSIINEIPAEQVYVACGFYSGYFYPHLLEEHLIFIVSEKKMRIMFLSETAESSYFILVVRPYRFFWG